jgi:hypothetical protein
VGLRTLRGWRPRSRPSALPAPPRARRSLQPSYTRASVFARSRGLHADASLKSFLFALKNPHNFPARKFALKAEQKDRAIFYNSHAFVTLVFPVTVTQTLAVGVTFCALTRTTSACSPATEIAIRPKGKKVANNLFTMHHFLKEGDYVSPERQL